jgi:PPOX class probable F420-dependent enzyme
MAHDSIPESHADLLQRPLFAHLATVRPDGSPQSSVMWFVYDGELVRFTHTSTRQKYRNMVENPQVAFSVADPDDQYRYVEVRGTVESITPDDDRASFYKDLQHRYGRDYKVPDIPVRVVVAVRPESFVTVGGGKVLSK